MSLRSRRPSEATSVFNPIIPSKTVARDAADVDASWWKRRDRQRQQPLPRLQLYAFDTTQANDELYAFFQEREKVRDFYSQSRTDGQRMGELEAVEGYGRADIMAIAWSRKGGADFVVRFIGHMDKILAEGYVIKTDVDGKFTWVVKLVRLYGEHILSLSSRTLFSLPMYTALASGLKFGLEDPSGGYGTIKIESAAVAAAVQAPVAIPDMKLSEAKLPPAAMQPGRCETGSFFSTQQSLGVDRGEKTRRGDKWTIVRPWDQNTSVNAVASYERYNPTTGPAGLGMRCVPQVKDSPVGVIFPTRGTPVSGMGKFVHRIDIEAVPIKSAMGLEATHAISAYRAYLYNDDIGMLVGTADIIPDARRNKDGKTISAARYIATPSVGRAWVGTGAESITIDSTDVKRCKEGDVCPWSLDLVCVIESAIHKMELGQR